MACEILPVDFSVRGIYTAEPDFRAERNPAVPVVLQPDGRVSTARSNWTRYAW